MGMSGLGMKASDAVSVTHILVIAFVIIGNVGYLIDRRKRKDK